MRNINDDDDCYKTFSLRNKDIYNTNSTIGTITAENKMGDFKLLGTFLKRTFFLSEKKFFLY